MTLKSYLRFMIGITIVLWTVSLVIIFNIDPESSGWIWKLLFYASLFLSFSGLLSVIGFAVRAKINKNHLAFHSVQNSFRQAFIISLFLIALLFLGAQKMFSWLNTGLLLILSLAAEYLLSGGFKKSKK